MDPNSNSPQYVSEDVIWYGVNFSAGQVGTLAPGATLTGSINIDAQSDFWCIKTLYSAFNATSLTGITANNRIIPLVTIIILGSSQNQMSNLAVPVASMFGTGELPFIWPRPRIFAANTNIQITASNFDTAITYDLRLQFMGFKKYRAN